ncbi:MAG: hypothetical protein JWQ04_2223 [Pedosphaera sp.]|nr:hypothetical protein [Pedosphaera sp.]
MPSKSTKETDESTEQLLSDLREVVKDGEELLRAGANQLNEKGAAMRERMSDALNRARETGRRLQEQTAAGARATDRIVRANPYQTIGAAFCVGVLIGAILNRK